MTPAPSSSRNRRSATLANIPPPPGPPPPTPPGHPNGHVPFHHQGLGHALSHSQSVNYGQGHFQQQQPNLYSNPIHFQQLQQQLSPPPSHSAHSSYSSASGQLNVNAQGQLVYPGGGVGVGATGMTSPLMAPTAFAPPRASFSSSSRASPSPVGGQSQATPPSRSAREKDQEAWSDSAWRSIFDAALVKAQQAVQLDELQESATAANLYAQAANDLARVIPMCSSEKKKQSMIAFQAIYLDRVAQLRATATKGGAPKSHQVMPAANEGNDKNYRYSMAGAGRMGYIAPQDQFQYQQQQQFLQQQQMQQIQQQQQQFHPHMYQTPSTPHLQHQRFQQPPPQQLHQHQQPQGLASPPMQSPFIQHQQLPFQQVQQQSQQQQEQDQPAEKIEKSDKGFRFFGKKRSKTQPSASQPPDLGPASQIQQGSYNQAPNGGDYDGFIPYKDYGAQEVGLNSSNSSNNNSNSNNATTKQTYDSMPYVMPPETPTPPPQVSAIFMTHAPPKTSSASASAALPATEPELQHTKSSKWKPFGKKKSKSFSTSNELAMVSSHEPEPAVPSFAPHVSQVAPTASLPTPVPQQESQQQQQPRHFVDPEEEAFLQQQHQQPPQNQSDWYVENTPEEDEDGYVEFDNPDLYFEDEDEDVDPYYIADTKGRARAFEGKEGKESKSNGAKVEAEADIKTRRTLNHSASSYSQENSFSPKFVYAQPVGIEAQADLDPEEQEMYYEQYDEMQIGETGATVDHPQSQQQQEQQPIETEHEEQGHNEHYVQEIEELAVHSPTHTRHVSSVSMIGSISAAPLESSAPSAAPSVAPTGEHVEEPIAEEKVKTRRTWYGKKKKDKVKDPDHLDNVAKLMDEALFGGSGGSSARSSSKEKAKAASKENIVLESTVVPPLPVSQPSPPQLEPIALDNDELIIYNDAAEVPIALDNDELIADDDVAEVPAAMVESNVETIDDEVLEPPILLAEAAESVTNESGFSLPGQDAVSIVSDSTKKNRPSRSFSIFKKKSKEVVDKEKDGGVLTPIVTNEESKSLHSHHTRKSSMQSDRQAQEMAVALSVRPREVKKKTSDEYVPYEYQEDVEGPLMERVEVPENREIIGFVLPVEEIIDYTYEENEEAAMENWDSWVSQLESFEKVLSDKGMKKEKNKKAKKVKEPKPTREDLGAVKANRSSIFGGISRSDTAKSRASSTLDLNSHLMDNSRPLSMSTTLMDDASIAPRASFQSSRSGGSEMPPQLMALPQPKKRWWKRKETPSMYRVSNAFSMADLEQDQHLSSLLLSQDQVKSSEDLSLDTRLMSMPILLNEPSTPAPSLLHSKEAPAAMESVPDPAPAPADEKKVEAVVVAAQPEAQVSEEEAEEAIAPVVKPKAKSNKPKLLPISTPLADLLKLQSAEELWPYVQQAKTYATSRMNKGDKRSAAIALKRGQALEARWQEILLEMASSDEDTDQLLEEEDSEEGEDSSEEEPALVVKKVKKVAVIAEPKPEEDAVVVPATKAAPVPASATVAIAAVVAEPSPTHKKERLIIASVSKVEEEEEEEEETYAAHRRKNTISRSSTTVDKYSKYKSMNKSPTLTSPTSVSRAILAEEDQEAGLATKAAVASVSASIAGSLDDGRLGSDATMDEMMKSTRVDHVKFYIQRMKTDTVAKARNGSKFAALEGMKNVKILQQRLEDLQNPPPKAEEKDEEEKEAMGKISSLPIVIERDEEEEEEEEKGKVRDAVKVTELTPVVEEREEEEEEQKAPEKEGEAEEEEELPVQASVSTPVLEEQDGDDENEWEESKGDQSPPYHPTAAEDFEDNEDPEEEGDGDGDREHTPVVADIHKV